MEVKNALPVLRLEHEGGHPFLRAYFEFSHLKQLYRQGWLKRGISKEQCESVAEHSFGAAILAYFLAEAYAPELDSGRVIRLALLHDFGEVYVGDLLPDSGISPQEKHALERAAVERIFAPLPNGSSLLELWEEYEAQVTPEARFVRQIDRLEMGLQASVYEQQGAQEMAQFYQSARAALVSPELVRLLEEAQALPRPNPSPSPPPEVV